MNLLGRQVVNPDFWRGRRVFLTGHTGFKGSWLSLWLSTMGANVIGFALPPNTLPNLYDVLKIKDLIDTSYYGDIKNFSKLLDVMVKAQPEIVIHMAAQPLVRKSYIDPIETYATNVLGTVHLLEAIRNLKSVRASVVITSDKCYENKEWVWGYRENEPMGGFDPYSNSKGCAELVVSAYRHSFYPDSSFSKHRHAIATARAGNVIGGGDWSEERLVPDALRAFEAQQQLIIRNPLATRPWQHVIEPLSGYLILAQFLYESGTKFASGWNFGPKDEDTLTVKELVSLLVKKFPSPHGWRQDENEQPHEAHSLKLDCSKALKLLGWSPKWNLEIAIKNTVDWHKAYLSKKDMREISIQQIKSHQINNISN